MKTTNRTTKSTKVTSLKWTALDKAPTKRWWWYVGFVAGSLWLGLLLIALHLWTGLAVLVAVVATVLVVYRWKPREIDVRLDAKNVVINGQAFPLKDYKSFRIEGEGEQVSIVLAPRKFLRLPVVITPSGDDNLDEKILAHLEKRLPYVDAQPGVLDRMARWLRLG